MSDTAPRDALVEQRAEANKTLEKIEFLLHNEQFLWFMDTVITPALAKEEKIALDVKKTSDERDKAVQRADAIREVSKWLPLQRTALKLRVENA